MDLAKIRKKSLQMVKELGDAHFSSPTSTAAPIKFLLETVPVDHASAEADFFQSVPDSAPVTAATAESRMFSAPLPEHVPAPRSPLEAILAGRKAAGCDEESISPDDSAREIIAEFRLEFLCFRVSDEIYGINIMDIKEIITPREVTEVPHTPLFVSGILSLRGTIIPIINLRVRLGLACKEPTGKERIIVIRNNNTVSGLLVDEVIKVIQVQPDAVEAAPAVLDGIDRDFISGLGRSEGRLIIILNLEKIADINLY